jgi:hypothetical protein
VQIELLPLEPEHVAEIARFDPVATEPLPKHRHVALNGVARSRRRSFAPERVDRLVRADQLARPEQQQREQRPLLRTVRRQIAPVVDDRQPPE